MTGKTFYIFRHGETLETKDVLPYPKENRAVEIIPEGRDAIKRLAEYMKQVSTDMHVSSEYVRCRETIKIVTEITGKQFVFDKRINEYDDWTHEPFELFTKRINNFLEEMRQSRYQSILVCTHGAVIAGLKHHLLGKPFARVDKQDYPKPGVLMIIANVRVEEIDFNKENEKMYTPGLY